MGEFKKEINLGDNKKLSYEISKEYVPMHTIKLVERDRIPKSIMFNKWDDYGFTSWYANSIEEFEKSTIQTHIIEKDYPIYIPLLHLLNGSDELIIDDDATYENNKKYMRIKLNEKNITIDFINLLNNNDSLEKYNVFIKNIGFDLRSKIDSLNLDTKERLYFFFREVYEFIKEEYHQVTIEEYLNSNNLLTKEEVKKYVKKVRIIS